jgi:hypothetical protein
LAVSEIERWGPGWTPPPPPRRPKSPSPPSSFCGLETSSYNTGSIADATYQGEPISNNQAKKILGCIEKVFYDAADGKLYVQWGYGNPRMGREQVWADIATGIRAAIAAL